ncbi:hypothetical protein [Arthrobacter sp. Ld5]|uniref:hypothetical protein n=1 Tax=Arthrobacter sp. Ld5 TaxID=649152 RepID=UPI003EBE4029
MVKLALLASCGIGAALLLTGCGAASGDAPVSPAASAPVADGSRKVELEARVSRLTDVFGSPLRIVSPEDAEVGVEATEKFFEGADIRPAECIGMVADGLAVARTKATAGVMGTGEADDAGGVLLLVILDDSAQESVSRIFSADRERLAGCSPLALTVGGTTTTLISHELPQDLIGEEAYALLTTAEEEGAEEPVHTLAVTARGNGVIVSAQSTSAVEPDGILQDHLAELAARALEPAGS